MGARHSCGQLLAQSLILSLAVVVRIQQNIRVDAEKTLDLKLQIWATYSFYVRQVHVMVRVKVGVNTENGK